MGWCFDVWSKEFWMEEDRRYAVCKILPWSIPGQHGWCNKFLQIMTIIMSVFLVLSVVGGAFERVRLVGLKVDDITNIIWIQNFIYNYLTCNSNIICKWIDLFVKSVVFLFILNFQVLELLLPIYILKDYFKIKTRFTCSIVDKVNLFIVFLKG